MSSTRSNQIKYASYDWKSRLEQLEGAYAEGTLRAYRADITTYEEWCNMENINPFPGTPQSIANFIKTQSETLMASTLKRRLAAISKIHDLLDLNNPIQAAEVKLALRRALRSKPSRPTQALGLNARMRNQLIKTCDKSLSGLRDKALISIGYDTLCRRSELVAIQLEDIEINDEKKGLILIRRSKNDAIGMGRIAYISPLSIKLLKIWLKSSRIESGPIFRPIKHNKVLANAIHPHSVNRIIKKTAEMAEMPENTIRGLSGHSMRVGAAQDMMKLGFDILAIMASGGWKTTNVVARYIEKADRSKMLRDFLSQ